ncbi:putative sit4-associated protein [Phaeomoniella chlamydospora]|uniref:Putative sit4-associated protein n=1 Tax=Phaeomoniella chlamydospora TaxID=158046 RepID=A0A0G2EMC0_PHACM|nr:putative sit4-associated protein [Phaeomoniella chlamydospora]
MFWRFGGYANISTIDTLLDKPDVTLEELLEESDLIQELKQHNTKLIEFLRDDNVLKKLLQYVTAPGPPEEEEPEDEATADNELVKHKTKSSDISEEDQERAEKSRLKYSYVACEILSSETWSILEALMQNEASLREFWSFMKRPPSLDPLQAGYFTKVNETLLEKKTEEMLEFLKTLDGVIPAMLQHVDCPMVMDLLLKIISLEKSEGGQGIVDWLQSQGLIPTLLSYLSIDSPPSTQTSAGDFLKAIITISANASQNEQSCIGPNSMTRQLVSEECVQSLVSSMLMGGNPLTVGVGIVIEVIRKNNSDYDPENGHNPDAPPTSHDPIYLGNLLRIFAKHVPDFMELILSSKHAVIAGDRVVTKDRGTLSSAWGSEIEPLGFDRFKTCELMAELLHCSNMGLLNERGSEDFIHQRDVERERLRAMGLFNPRREGEDSAVDMSEDSLQFNSGASVIRPSSDAPEDARNASASDEDGFEEVARSDVPSDPEKANPPSADDTFAEIQEKTGLTLESDLVDEPLSSPRRTEFSEKVEDVEMPSPLKPRDGPAITSDNLVEGVRRVSLEDTTMSSPPPEEQTQPSLSSSPVEHRDDVPKALFGNDQSEKTLTSQSPDTHRARDDHGIEDPGNTSSQSVVMGELEDRQYPPGVELEANGKPVVGDYLKLMFVENKVVPTVLSFFFRFPWNNFLHNVVYDVIQQVFNGPMDRGFNRSLAIDLFETGSITEQIVDGQRRSDEAQQTKNMRLGYMGHLTLVAEEVVKFSERHPPELLSQSVMERVLNQQWIDYVEQTLSDTRERDNAILGGVRPDMSVGPRQAVLNAVNAAQNFGGSSALANAGLTGGHGLDSVDLSNNGSASSGAYGSSGSLLSGFGSSSDDDDEEMEEAEDESSHDNATRAALQLTTADAGPQSSENESDQPIPLLPPPPAPLNVPPSRARRQLAARLAMHKQQAAEAEATMSETGGTQAVQGTSKNSESPFFDSDNNDDPFKALGDDDVEDDGDENSGHVEDDEAGSKSGERSSKRGLASTGFVSVGRGISSLFSTSNKTKRPQARRSKSNHDDFGRHSSEDESTESDSSSEDDHHPLEATTSKERIPIDGDSDEEMGEMVAPSMEQHGDSSDEELVLSPIERERLGLPVSGSVEDKEMRRANSGLLDPHSSTGIGGHDDSTQQRHFSFDEEEEDEFGAEIGADKSDEEGEDVEIALRR